MTAEDEHSYICPCCAEFGTPASRCTPSRERARKIFARKRRCTLLLFRILKRKTENTVAGAHTHDLKLSV
ncbi:hypothetical protein MHYP_G00136840 [Metynnis hypsauchen]